MDKVYKGLVHYLSIHELTYTFILFYFYIISYSVFLGDHLCNAGKDIMQGASAMICYYVV